MAIVYGYDVTGADDHFIVIADETMELLTEAMLPGASMMNVLPILRFIPAWFPGAAIQRLAVLGRKLGKEMREVPFDMVQKQTVSAIHFLLPNISFARDNASKLSADPLSHVYIG